MKLLEVPFPGDLVDRERGYTYTNEDKVIHDFDVINKIKSKLTYAQAVSG